MGKAVKVERETPKMSVYESDTIENRRTNGDDDDVTLWGQQHNTMDKFRPG